MLMGKWKNFSCIHVQVYVCVCKRKRERGGERENEREWRRAQVTAAYAKHSENIHSAFGEQGTRYALGIQFRLWLKAMSWLCVWLRMSVSVCSLSEIFFFLFLMLHWNSRVVGLGGPPVHLHICVPPLAPPAVRHSCILSLLLQAWLTLQIPSRQFVAPILNHWRSWMCDAHTGNQRLCWWEKFS